MFLITLKKMPRMILILCIVFILIPDFVDNFDQYYIDDLAWFLLLLPIFVFSYYLGVKGGLVSGILANAYHMGWLWYEKRYNAETVINEEWTLHVGVVIITLLCALGVGILSDKLREQKHQVQILNEKLMKLALYDSLTGLPNRRYFMEKLTRLINEHEEIALLFIDLDGFKQVNDFYGHEEGDHLLKEIAEKINLFQDDSVFVSRLGGDEFTIVVKSGDKQRVMSFANQILNLLQINKYEVSISASIGVSMCEQGYKAETLLKKADSAMYKAKLAGKNSIFFLDSSMHC